MPRMVQSSGNKVHSFQIMNHCDCALEYEDCSWAHSKIGKIMRNKVHVVMLKLMTHYSHINIFYVACTFFPFPI